MLFGKRLKKRFISLTGLILIGLAVHFLDVQRPQPFDLFSDVPETTSEPDYYTVNSTFKEFNADGNLNHSISTDRLLHYPDRQEATLENPLIIAYDRTGRPDWQASALTGLVEGDGSHFQLNQNVIVWQEASTANTAAETTLKVKLETEQLFFDLDHDKASTEEDVRLITPDGITYANGLDADMKTGQISLKRQVKGHYPADH